MLPKPPQCAGCDLEHKGLGYAPGVGPAAADLMIVGEALGEKEAFRGQPFIGPAGMMLDKILRRVGVDRKELRIDNTVRCQPPKNWLAGAPWEPGATAHCAREYLWPAITEWKTNGGKVIVATGASPTRRLLNLPSEKHVQANWHGCPTLASTGSSPSTWVVPTFHPSFLLKGNQKLIGTVAFDILRAKKVAKEGWHPRPTSLVVDPDIGWYANWVAEYEAQSDAWLAVDIETSGKIGMDEGELDEVGSILRINFAFNPDQGITVPWGGPWQALTERLLLSSGVKCFWNARFDTSVLRLASIRVGGPVLDFMWAWHVLQSDLPRGLGFVAPFYSDYGAWKHLSGSDPGTYAAIDAVQTMRVAFGIAKDLKDAGQWDTFIRHVYEFDSKVLGPAEEVGLLVNKERLTKFKGELAGKILALGEKLGELVPEEILELHPKGGWVKPPKVEDFIVTYKRGDEKFRVAYKQKDLLKQESAEMVHWCKTCYQTNVTKKHRCAIKTNIPNVVLEMGTVDRFYVREPFNPNSTDHLLAYLKHRGHKAGKPSKGAKTEKGSVGKQVLEALAKTTKDPLYKMILDHRAVAKVMGTYVEGTEKRVKADGRVHPKFLHVPSTMRLSCTDPNLQNVVADKAGAESIAAGFRACLVAASGSVLIAADYSGIEAVETGWCSGDPDYVRLATLGVHAYLTSHAIGEPARITDSDEVLGDYFAKLKKSHPVIYDRSKRTVHGTSYGMTPYGLAKNYPEHFTIKTATEMQELLYAVAPKLKAFQHEVRQRAFKNGYLGGKDHPFGYKHWFWQVYNWDSKRQEWSLGEDGKRCVAFYPQSISAGVLAEAALRLVDPESPYFIGDLFHGKTPLRALIHDEILLEVPKAKADIAMARLVGAMEEPIRQQPLPWKTDEFLVIKATVKAGPDWGAMTHVPRGEIGVAADTAVHDWDDEEDQVEIA